MAGNRLGSEEYPYLPIRLRIRGWRSEAMALLDTGFSDQLIIPPSEFDANLLGEPDNYATVEVADGRIVHAPVCLATLSLGSTFTLAEVTAIGMGDRYIIGRGIIGLSSVTLDHGERLVIEL